MKRMAMAATPKIRPIRVAGMNRRYLVGFAGPLGMRNLKADTTLTQAQREVVITSQNEKFFQGGDVDWDGILVHEVDGIEAITGVGAGGIDVEPFYLCGAQAVGLAQCKRWETKTQETDYEDKFGVAVRCIDGLEKLLFGSGAADTDDLKQHGIVTGYFAGVAD